MSRKLRIFNDIWLKHFKWLSPSSDFHRAYCEICSSSVFVGHSGIWAIIAHAKAQKHKENLAKNSNRKSFARMPKLDIQVPIHELKNYQPSSSISSHVARSSPNNIIHRSKSCQDLATQEEFNVASSSVHPLKETVNMDNVNEKNKLKNCLLDANDDGIVREITPDTKNAKISQDHMQEGRKSREDNSSIVAVNVHRTSSAELTTTVEVLSKDFQDGSIGNTIKRKKIKLTIGNNKPSKSQTTPEKIKQANSFIQFSKEKSEKSVRCCEQTSGPQAEVPKFQLSIPRDIAHSLSKSEFLTDISPNQNFSVQQMSQCSQQKTQATETSSKKDVLVISLPDTEPLCKRPETENPLILPVQRPLKHEIQHKKRVNGKSNTFERPSSQSLSNSVDDVNGDKMHQNSKEKHRKKILQIETTREYSTTVQDIPQRKSKAILKARDNCSALANVSFVSKIPKQNKKSLCKPYERKVVKKTNTQKRCEVNTSINKKHGDQTSKKQELCSAKDYFQHLAKLDTCFFASTHSQKKASSIRNISPKPSKNSLLKNVALPATSRPNSSALNNSIGFDSLSNSDERLGQSTCNYSETESADVQFMGIFRKSDISSCNYRSAIPKTEVEGTSGISSQNFDVENISSSIALRNACRIPPNTVNSPSFLPRVTDSFTSRGVKIEMLKFSPRRSSECNSKTVAGTQRCHVSSFPEESMSLGSVSNCLIPFDRKMFNIKDFRAGISCFSNRLLEKKRTFEAESGQILQELEMFLSQAIAMKSSNTSEFDFIDPIYDRYRSSPKRNMLDVIKLLLALCSDNPDSSKTHKFSEGESFSSNELNQLCGILNGVPGCSSKKECTDRSSSANNHISAETTVYENKVLRNHKRQL